MLTITRRAVIIKNLNSPGNMSYLYSFKPLRYYLFLLVIGVSFISKAQNCSPFLGGNKGVIACTNPFQINYNDLFATDANIQIILLPPFDVIPGPNGDTIINYLQKTLVRATNAQGCKDSAVVRIVQSKYDFPDAGRDTSIFTCPGVKIDISKFSKPSFFETNWSTLTPFDVDTGYYDYWVTTPDKCSDTITIKVLPLETPDLGNDTTVTVIVEDRVNLFLLKDTTGLDLTWNIPNPAQATKGIYRLMAVSKDGCYDTAFLTVRNHPQPNLGPDQTICSLTNVDITQLFVTDGLTMDWGTNNPVNTAPGIYRVIGANSFGSRDTAFVKVLNNTLEIGEPVTISKCVSEYISLPIYFNLAGLTAEWTVTDPESVLEPGLYYVKATDENGCVDQSHVIVELNPLPSVNDTTVFVCGGNTKDLTKIYDLSGYGVSTWDAEIAEAAKPGVYTLTIQDEFGCDHAITVEVIEKKVSQTPFEVCNYQSGSFAFTTNSIRSVAVDRIGNVWAGADGGGLYRFQHAEGNCGGTWIQASIFPSTTFKDIVPFNLNDELCNCESADRLGLWIANSGSDLSFNNAGGIFNVRDEAFSNTRYGSVDDINGIGPFLSRNANSLAIGADNKLYAAFGLSLNPAANNKIMEGGVYSLDLANVPAGWTRLGETMIPLAEKDIKVSAAGARGNEVWFATQPSCITIPNQPAQCFAPAILRFNTTINNTTGAIRQPLPFTASTTSAIVRSIFTDSRNNTFIGFNAGEGLAIVDADEKIFLINSDNSPLPPATSINFNSMAEVNGEVWIGTTKGLLVYDGLGSFDDCASFTLYTTAHNLPSNNITDVAYDELRQEVWLATDAGVCRLKEARSITGTVVNGHFGNFDAISPVLIREPLPGAKVALYKSTGEFVADVLSSETGSFEFLNTIKNEQYKILVSYKDKYRYSYENFRYNQNVGDLIIPDSLILSLDTLKKAMHEKKYNYSIFFYQSKDGVIAKGFDTTGFHFAYKSLLGDVTGEHEDLIKRTGQFYNVATTLYNYATMADAQFAEIIKITASVLDMFGGAVASKALDSKPIKEFLTEMSPPGEKPNHSARGKAAIAGVEIVKTILDKTFSYANEKTVDPKLKKDLTTIKDGLMGIMDLTLATIKDGHFGGFGKILEKIKKDFIEYLIANVMAYQYEDFCNEKFGNFIGVAAIETYTKANEFSFENGYKRIYDIFPKPNINNNSVHKKGIDTSAYYTKKVTDFNNASEIADVTAGILEGVAAILTGFVVTVEFAVIAEALATAAKTVKYSTMGLAWGYSGKGWYRLRGMSEKIGPTSGYPKLLKSKVIVNEVQKLAVPDADLGQLNSLRTLFNTSLQQFRTAINAPYDSSAIYGSLNILTDRYMDYLKSIDKTLSILEPLAAQPSIQSNEINAKLALAMDSLFPMQATNADAMFNQVDAYLFANPRAPQRNKLNLYIDSLQLFDEQLNDVLDYLVKNATAISIPEGPHLKIEDYQLKSDRSPGSIGKAVYTIVNRGNGASENLRAEIGAPGGGFLLLSPQSFNLGVLQPGEMDKVEFTFLTPLDDTAITTFPLIIKSEGTEILNITCFLYTSQAPVSNIVVNSVKAGLWSEPTTWSTGQVPSAESAVTIRHTVTVDMDATCKTLKAESPAQVQVAVGKKLTIMK